MVMDQMKAYWKDIFRSISKGKKRFLSIMLITCLGVTVLTGIGGACIDLRYSADSFFDNQELFDIQVVSTLGLTEDDVTALWKLKGVSYAEGGYNETVYTYDDGQKKSAAVYTLSKGGLNKPYVIEGYLPENDNEIAVTRLYLTETGKKVGDKIIIEEDLEDDSADNSTDSSENGSSGNSENAPTGTGSDASDEDDLSVDDIDLEDSSNAPNFPITEYTITASVIDPMDINTPDGTVSFRSTRTTDYTFFVTPRSVDSDIYTVIYLQVDDTKELLCYSDAYNEKINEVMDQINSWLKDERQQARYDEIVNEANSKIDDAQNTMDDKFADAEKEIADARQTIEDGRAELDDAKSQLESGRDELNEGQKTLDEKKAELADGEKQISQAEKELQKGQDELDKNREKLEAAQKELNEQQAVLSASEKELYEGEQELYSKEAEITANEKLIDEGEQQLYEKEAELIANEKLIDEGEQELYKQEAELLANEKLLDEKEQELLAGEAELDEQEKQLASAETEIKANEASLALVEQALQYALNTLDEIQTKGIAPIVDRISSLEGQIAELNQKSADNGGLDEADQLKLDTYKAELDTLTAAKEAEEAEYAKVLAQVDELTKEFTDGKQQLEDAKKQVADGKAQIAAYREQIADGKAQIADGRKQIADGKKQLAEAKAQIADSRKQIDDGKKQLAEAKAQIADGRKQIDDGKKQLADAKSQLADGKAQIADGKSQIESAQAEIDKGNAQIADGQAQIDSGKQQIELNKLSLESGKSQIESAQAEIDEGKKELEENAQKIEDGYKELDDGEAELNENIDTFNEKKAEALNLIEDAREKVSDLEMAKWYVQKRTSLSGYANVQSDADSIEALGTAFPALFFIIAILICMTTITRMVEEDRSLLGTFKALGFSDREIRRKYELYAVIACVLGGILGNVIGFIVLPEIIFIFFKVMYMLPSYVLRYTVLTGIGGILLFVAGIYLTTRICCNSILKEQPAQLMRPKAPMKGSRVFLEYITPLWRHMSFLSKVTARNLFRYKKRLFMTVTGIMGCTGLLICGFAIKDSVTSLADKQYDITYHYDLMLVAQDTESLYDAISSESSDSIEDFIPVEVQSVTITCDNEKDMIVQLIVIPDSIDSEEYISLYDTRDNPITLENGDVYITQNAGEVLGFGDDTDLIVQDLSLNTATVHIDKLVRNYLGNNIYMKKSTYEKLFGDFELNGALIHLTDTMEGPEQAAFAKNLAKEDGILSAVSTYDLKDTFSEAFILIDLVVYVLIILSAGLAFTVLFTLATTNISERERELATIKVLGFFDTEVHSYVNKETLILTVLGIGLGIPVGSMLSHCLTWILKMPSLYFDVSIRTISFVISAGLAFIFAILVNLITNRSLNAINPIEALKSIE